MILIPSSSYPDCIMKILVFQTETYTPLVKDGMCRFCVTILRPLWVFSGVHLNRVNMSSCPGLGAGTSQ